MSEVEGDDPARRRSAERGGAAGAGRRLVVLGQGRIGLPLALRAVAAGYQVLGYDHRASRVRRLTAGDPQFAGEPRQALVEALGTGRYTVTGCIEDCAGFDTAVIAEPTPRRGDAPDPAAIDATLVEQAAVVLAPLVTRGSLVILETTTYPGTTEQLLIPTLELISGLQAGPDFSVGYSPEGIDPAGRDPAGSSALAYRPARAVSGIDSRSAELTRTFYAGLGDAVVTVPQIRDAELAKLAQMTLQHGTPAMIERLASLVADLGLDLWAMIERALPRVTDGPEAERPGCGPAPPGPHDPDHDRGPDHDPGLDAGSADPARLRPPIDGALTTLGYVDRTSRATG